jgi:hypothetical protein
VGLRGINASPVGARLRLRRTGWRQPVQLVAPSGAMTPTARSRRHRERRAAGRLVLSIELDEVSTVEMLCEAHLLDRQRDHSRGDISRALVELIEFLASDSR